MSNSIVIALSPKQIKFKNRMLKPWLLRLFLFGKIPMGWLSGMKVIAINEKEATTTVNHRWFNQNPFRSMYFAVQGMAAELSTGSIALMAIEGEEPKIIGIITGMDAEFMKKASSRVFFTCSDGEKLFDAVEQCKKSDEQVSVKVKAEGKTKDGTTVAIFHFIWSFKRRS
jgi:hypothetical protein